MGKLDENINELSEKYESLLNKIDYNKLRDFEKEIKEIVKYNKEEVESLSFEIDSKFDDLIKDNFLDFTKFYIAFTFFRVKNYNLKLENLIKKANNKKIFQKSFSFKFLEFIAKYKNENVDKHNQLIDEMRKNENQGIFEYSGSCNFYSEVVADYYESNLSLLDNDEDKEIILEAIQKLNNIINIEKYSKFYLNLGRLNALVNNQKECSKNINKAFELLQKSFDDKYETLKAENTPTSKNKIDELKDDYEKDINFYKTIENRIIDIRTYFSLDKVRESQKQIDNKIEKGKFETIKIISIISTAIGYLIGGIKVFENISNPLKLALTLLIYSGIFFILIGTIFIAFRLVNSVKIQNKTKSDLIIGIILISFGIIMIVFSTGILLFLEANNPTLN